MLSSSRILSRSLASSAIPTAPSRSSIRPTTFDFDSTQLLLPTKHGIISTHRRREKTLVFNSEQKQQNPLKSEVDKQRYAIQESRKRIRGLRASDEPVDLDAFFNRHGIFPSVYNYTRLIKLQHAHGLTQSCISTYRTMIDAGKYPNNRTFAAILGALVIPEHSHMMSDADQLQRQRPLYEEACRIWSEVQSSEAIAGCHFLYSTMMKVYAAMGDSTQAKSLLAQMETRDIKITSLTLERAVRACTRNNQWRVALDVFDEYRHLAGIVSCKLYTSMIQVAGKLRMVARASQLFEEIIEVGHDLTTIQFNAIMHSIATSGHSRSYVIPMYERMRENQHCVPDAHTMTIVMIAAARLGNVDIALQLIEQMSKLNLGKPTLQVLFRQFLSCLSTSQRYTPGPYTLVRSSCGSASLSVQDRAQIAEEVLEAMQIRYDLEISLPIMNSLLYVYTLGGLTDGALTVFESFATHNLVPDLVSYKALLDRHIKAILPPELADLHRLTSSKAWSPDEAIRLGLRQWARQFARRQSGIDALEYVLS